MTCTRQSSIGTKKIDASEYPNDYKVEKLLGHRKTGRGNGNEYLVRWAGKDTATDLPMSARRQPASRAAPLGALGRRSAMREPAMREPAGADIGVSRSSLTCSLSAAAAMVGAEPSARRQRRQRRQPWGLSRRIERRGGDGERA